MGLIKKIQSKLATLSIESLFLNSGSVFIRRIIGMGLSFIWVFAITNFFGSETYGFFSISQVVINFLAVIFGLGIDTVIIKFGSMKEHYSNGIIKSNFFKKALILTLLSSIVCGILILLSKDVIAFQIFRKEELSKYFTYIGWMAILFLFHKPLVNFLSVQGKFNKYGNFYFLFPNAFFLIWVFLAYYLAWKPYTIIVGYLLSYGVFGIIQLFFLIKTPKEIKLNISYRKILMFSTPMMISSSFLFISNWTDILMLGAMVNESDVGIYNAAFKMGSLVLVIIAAVNAVLSPKISNLFDKNNIQGIKIEVLKATRIISYVSLPAVIFLALFSKEILSLFGEEFMEGKWVLIIISAGMLFNAMSGSVGQILNMTNYQKQFRNFTIISALLNIVLNYFLISKYGIEGAAIASLISNLVINIMCLVLVKQKFNFYAFFRI